ncbi:MAG: alpha-1,4-glucan--maltose-1-phosphate maltosyltransferase [Nitrospirota bacterium]
MREVEGRTRVVIESVAPEIDGGRFPIKRVVGEKVIVEADIFADGHDKVTARLLYKGPNSLNWQEVPMRHIENDRWGAEFFVEEIGIYKYTVTGWINRYETWRDDLKKKFDAGRDITVEILQGVRYIEETLRLISGEDKERLQMIARFLITEQEKEKLVSTALNRETGLLMEKHSEKRFAARYGKELRVVVDRPKALFSSWYELFPRSCPRRSGKHGTLKDVEAILPEIVRMGFDVLYLSPIHPVGRTNRKGKNNVLSNVPDDVGSPWAIGSDKGGHKSIHPDLGKFEDFKNLIDRAKEYGIEIAMDIAFQCSPDHPYVKEHPDWFNWRPDGTLQFAENPPKKYEDIVPLNFECDQWRDLWEELKSVVLFWIEKGVRIFRVDNPHTKPFPFWEWLITGIKKDYPDVIFLSEAFTRPKVMYRLAKLGFTQSYTYFAWRNTKSELGQYINELTTTEIREYFRPSFWPNTPDILTEFLQYGGRNAFMMRLVLAATLSSNYGIYGPPFELAVREALPGKEEYLNSEKYEIKEWDWDREGNLKEFIARINKIRRENPALQATSNIMFYEVDNDSLLFFGKTTEDLSNVILVIVNLDPFHKHSGWVRIPVLELGIDPGQPYLVHDLLGDDKYIWHGERNFVEVNPHISPAYVFRVRKRLKRETDFDYFM